MADCIGRRRLQALQNERATIENIKAQRVGDSILSFTIVWRMS